VHPRSSLSEAQRESAVVLFEAGFGERAVATRLGVSRNSVRRLRDRWRLRSAAALVRKPGMASFTFEFKREAVRRIIEGEATAGVVAREHDLSSPKLVESWVRLYRRDGVDALRPKAKGRPARSGPATGSGELEQLRAENLRLSAENAYLKKVRALRDQGHG
jgi:transposase